MIGSAVKTSQLSKAQCDAMFSILEKHFGGVTRDIFYSDLEEKNWVILLKDEKGGLVGFSTILKYHLKYKNEKYCIIYSGDTIVDKSAWGSFELPKIWIKTVRSLGIDKNEKLLWLLISSGFRTYRFLPVFWNEFYPRHDLKTPVEMKSLIDHLASHKFGQYYNKKKGTVLFPKPQWLKKGLVEIPDGKLNNPHIAFFKDINPGYIHGDELVCLTEISDNNLTKAGRRMFYANDSFVEKLSKAS